MLYQTSSHAAHRATTDGGLGLLVRGGTIGLVRGGSNGQHRQPPSASARPRPQRRAPYEPERAANWLFRGLAALIVLGVAVMVGFLAVSDRRVPPGSDPASAADPLATRAGDPVPLSLDEVFPGSDSVQAPGSTYRLGVTHVDAECRTATTGELGQLLKEYGCSQVVRAALSTPYGDYQVTAGIFNLTDAQAAAAVDSQLRSLVETADGSFAPMAGGSPGAGPTGQVGWRTRGHYLVYCVITRPGGQVVTAGDPNAERITTDLVDGYLGETVLGSRGSGA